jgi:tetratricopeptide (TPR) repeat protein
MAILTLHLAEMLKFDYDITTARHFDLLAVSRLFLDRGDSSGAMIILESLINLENSDVASHARRALSLIYKRSGRWSDAVRIWESILMDDPGNYFAVEELAKWFEHKCRDFKKAIDVVSKALNLPYLKTAAEKEALIHRLERLKGRTTHIHTE